MRWTTLLPIITICASAHADGAVRLATTPQRENTVLLLGTPPEALVRETLALSLPEGETSFVLSWAGTKLVADSLDGYDWESLAGSPGQDTAWKDIPSRFRTELCEPAQALLFQGAVRCQLLCWSGKCPPTRISCTVRCLRYSLYATRPAAMPAASDEVCWRIFARHL